MPDKRGRIHCQRCLAANPLDHESCARCGTRLMLVVEPSSLRFEEETVLAGDYEEHMLERVTALESRLGRVAEKLEHGLELLLRQSRTSYLSNALLETLIGVLGEAGAVDPSKLEALWRGRCEREKAAAGARGHLDTLRGLALGFYAGGERQLFARLLDEGFRHFAAGETAGGLRKLERAAALAPENAPLNGFLGAHFFRAGKTALARDYLSRALVADPEDGRVRILLGLACGDEGESARAKELLVEAVRRGGPSFAAHYALGRLSAAESDWKSALSEFKRALGARERPEAHYVVGLVYYQLGRYRMALRHLTRAVELEPAYAAAYYLLGLVHLRLGARARAGEAFDAAQSFDAHEPRYRAARRRLSRAKEVPPPPLFTTTRAGKRRLVTGGDNRLAAALQEDALGTAAPR